MKKLLNNKKAIILMALIFSILTLTGCSDSANALKSVNAEKLPVSNTNAVVGTETSKLGENTKPEAGSKVVAKGEMQVHFFDVGQGDSSLIITPEKKNILIDGGDNKYGDTVVKYLNDLGIDTIDIMIATHPDADHIGGLDVVLYNKVVKKVYAPKVSHTTKTYQDFLLAVKNEGVKITEAKAGVSLNLSDVDANFIAPVKLFKDDLNANSAVLRLVHGEVSYIFTGDATTLTEEDMIANTKDLKSTVLKVGHHGANTSTGESFLNSVNPEYAVISVGAGNKYNHPTKETLKKLGDRGIATYRTDSSGTIISISDGKKVMFNSNSTKNIEIPGTINKEPNKEQTNKNTQNAGMKLSANLDNYKPKQNGSVILNVGGATGLPYTATLKYKSKDTVYTGVTGTPLSINIGRASKGYKVDVNIVVDNNGKKETVKTAFTPQ